MHDQIFNWNRLGISVAATFWSNSNGGCTGIRCCGYHFRNLHWYRRQATNWTKMLGRWIEIRIVFRCRRQFARHCASQVSALCPFTSINNNDQWNVLTEFRSHFSESSRIICIWRRSIRCSCYCRCIYSRSSRRKSRWYSGTWQINFIVLKFSLIDFDFIPSGPFTRTQMQIYWWVLCCTLSVGWLKRRKQCLAWIVAVDRWSLALPNHCCRYSPSGRLTKISSARMIYRAHIGINIRSRIKVFCWYWF